MAEIEPASDVLGEGKMLVNSRGKVFPPEKPYETELAERLRAGKTPKAPTGGTINYDPPWNEQPGGRWVEEKRHRRAKRRK